MSELNARLAEAFARLPDYLGGHVRVSLAALALGIALSIPLALVSIRRPAFRATVLAFSSVVQTIPGLALLALFYPLLLGLAALSERALGVSFSALGFLPAVLALALYSLLPVLRNAITGLTGIDPAIKEAARGVGMTPRQALWMVELPLALPVIMAGVRTAAVWVIGTATLSTPIGQTSLGNYIFAGLQTQNWVFVLFGCVAAAVLAPVLSPPPSVLLRGGGGRARGAAARARARRARDPRGRAHRRGVAAARLVPAAGALPGRRQDVHRAIRARRPDRAAAARCRALRRPARRTRLERCARRARQRRDRRLCRLLRHDLGERPAPQRRQAARGGPRGGRQVAEGTPRDHAARRPRLRERLRAGDAEKARRGARHPLDRRSGARRAAAHHRGRLRVLQPARMARDPRRLRPVVPCRAHHAARVHVLGRRRRRSRRGLGLYERGTR